MFYLVSAFIKETAKGEFLPYHVCIKEEEKGLFISDTMQAKINIDKKHYFVCTTINFSIFSIFCM